MGQRGASWIVFVVLSLVVIAGGGLVSAQGTSASISGTVADSGGAIVPGVTVIMTNVETGIARSLVTDDSGRYRAPALELGRYELKAELAGFQTSIRRGIELTLGRNAIVDITLKVGEISEQVTVTGEASLVETTSSTIAGLVTTQQIADLPLNGRNMMQLTLLESGVNNIIRSSAANNNSIRGYGIDITVAGARNYQNTFLLDGADINDAHGKMPGSLAGVQMGVDSVREFKILTANFNAEYGRAVGGIITAVTKAGTNEFHGSLFEYLRNSALDANNFIGNSRQQGKSPFKRNQFGGSVGGPIVRERTFFFANVEVLRDRLGVVNIMNVPTVEARQGIIPGFAQPVPIAPQVRPYLNLWPLPDMCGAVPCRANGDGLAEKAVSDSEPTNENYIVAKVDHNFSQNHSLLVRFVRDSATKLNAFNTITRGQLTTGAQYWTLEEKSIFTPRVLNVFRSSFIRTIQTDDNAIVKPPDPSLYFLPYTGQLGAIWINGTGGFGSPVQSPTPYDDRPRLFTQNLFHFSDGLTYSVGHHSFKVGAEVRRYQVNGLAVSRNGGRYRFPSFVDFLQARPNQGEGALPSSDFVRGMREWIPGFYFQDDFQIRPNLTLNLGLRYEFYTVPTEVNGKLSNLRFLNDKEIINGDPYFPNPSKKNFAPRVGFSWDPFGNGKTAIRAAFGIFHELIDIPGMFLQPWFSMPPATRFDLRSNIPFPNPLANGLPAGSFTVFTYPWGGLLKNPYLMKWNLNVQKEIAGGLVATVGYIGSRGVHLWDEAFYQVCRPEFTSDGQRFIRRGCDSRRNPGFGGIAVEQTPGSSFYHALAVKVSRRLTHGVTLAGSYTFSKSMDDTSGNRIASGPGGTVQNWQGAIDNIKVLRARSDFDIRNNISINGSWAVPGPSRGLAQAIAGGWQVNGILTLSDGYPVTVKINNTYLGDGSTAGGFMPDLISGGNNNPVLGGPDKYFDLAQFAAPRRVTSPSVLAGCTAALPCTFFGNLGRNTLIAPGVATVDFSAVKKWPLRYLGEQGTVEFRSEFFNITNRSNFDAPQLQVFDSQGACCGTAGRVLATTTTARQIQFAMRIIF